MEHTVLLFLSYLSEAVILWLYASGLFVPSHRLITRLSALGALYTALFILSLLRQIGINTVSYFLINIFFLYTFYGLKRLSAFFHSALLTAVMGISELAVFGITTRLFPHFLISEGVGLIMFMVLSKTFFFASVYLLIHLFRGKKTSPDQYGSSELLLMLIPVSSIFIIITFFTVGNTSAYTSPADLMVTISSVSLLMVNLLVFGINQYIQRRAQEYSGMQLLLQKESDSAEYYKMMLSQNENQNILIHDIKNHLQSIRLLNEKNESDKINAYIQQLMQSSDLSTAARVCDNPMLNAILCRYRRRCSDQHIAFHTDIRSGTVKNISPYDITSLFCNLLDNAMQSAEKIPDSYIELTVQKNETSASNMVSLINSCQSSPVFDRDGLPVSRNETKDRHGFGIKSICRVVKQYNGVIEMYYDQDSCTFHTILTLIC